MTTVVRATGDKTIGARATGDKAIGVKKIADKVTGGRGIVDRTKSESKARHCATLKTLKYPLNYLDTPSATR